MPKKILLIAGATLLAFACTARAQYQGWVGPGAAVDINYYDTDFNVGNASYGTQVTEIGAMVAEHFTPDFALAIGAGYAHLNMGDNPMAAPFSLTGYYARVAAHFDPALFSSNFGLSFRVGADYQRVNDTHKGTELVDHWTSYMGAAGPWLRLGSVTLEGGVVYRHASGNQDLSGKINSTEDLSYASSSNPYLGLVYHPDVDWTVAFRVEGGGRKSAGLALGYHFSPF